MADMEKSAETMIIWDFNGTILNDVSLCLGILNTMLARRGLETQTLSQYQSQFGFPVKAYYSQVGFDFRHESFDRLADEYMAMYRPASVSCPLRSGILEVLMTLRCQGFRQVLLSATERSFLIGQIGELALGDYFCEILGLDNFHGSSKVSMAQEWFRRNDLDAKPCLIVGDTVHDHEVALTLGCRCVLLSGGHNSRERLVMTGSEVIDHPVQLIGWIAQI